MADHFGSVPVLEKDILQSNNLHSVNVISDNEKGGGRSLVAAEDFEKDETILSEEPVSAVVLNPCLPLVCDNCFRDDSTAQEPAEMIPCLQCNFVYWCSKRCCRKGAAVHHAIECAAFRAIYNSCSQEPWLAADSSDVRLVTRVMMTKVREDLKMGRPTLPGKRFKDQEMLIHNFDLMSEEILKAIDIRVSIVDGAFEAASTKHAALGNKWWKEKDLIRKLFLRLQSNAHVIQDCFGNRMGVGLYCIGSMINHSCAPSAAYIHLGSTLVVKSLRRLRRGEEITFSYCDLLYDHKSRQQHLSTVYCFKCQCQRCGPRLEVNAEAGSQQGVEEGLVCPTPLCGGLMHTIPTTADGLLWICEECSNTRSDESVRRTIADVEGVMKKAEEESKKEYMGDMATIFSEFNSCGGNTLFHPTSREITLMNAFMASYNLSKKKYMEAVASTQRAIIGIARAYGIHHPRMIVYLYILADALVQATDFDNDSQWKSLRADTCRECVEEIIKKYGSEHQNVAFVRERFKDVL